MKKFLSTVVGYGGLALLAGCASDSGAPKTGETRNALSQNLVIAAVYGGGGNAAAPFTHDYVMLFNRGSAAASLNGLSIQYDNAAGDFVSGTDVLALPNVSVQPGQYFLIQLNSNGNVGAALPTADASDPNIGLSNNNGKVALVTQPLNGCGASNNCPTTNIVDLVGYGTASSWEGPSPDGGSSTITGLSNTMSANRKAGGCTETDNNASDFEAGAPAPKNTATAAAPCSVPVDSGTDAATGGAAGSGGTAGTATGGAAGTATGGAAGTATGGTGGATGGTGGGTGGVGAVGGFGGSGGKKASSSEDDGGCGCSIPGSEHTPAGSVVLVGLGLVLAARRRRR